MTIDDPNFGQVPVKMPNYQSACPKCGRSILFWRELPILSEETGVITEIALKCQNKACPWEGKVRGPAVYPFEP